MFKKLRQKLFAKSFSKKEKLSDQIYGDVKRELFSDISGIVLEIGPGTGSNFFYYPSGISWVGIEPNVFMNKFLKEKINGRNDIKSEIKIGSAENIDLPDSSVDFIVSTLVLCSVKDVNKVLAEIKRILKPGGKFIFIEHVVAPKKTFLHFFQNILTPFFKITADNCHLNRDILSYIKNNFNEVEYNEFIPKYKLGFLTPHIIGYAKK